VTTYPREEIEAAFAEYRRLGVGEEDWPAWAKLFTDDALYEEHNLGVFKGQKAIEEWIVSCMKDYSTMTLWMEWYAIDGNRVALYIWNNLPDPTGTGKRFGFPNTTFLEYAGDGKFSFEGHVTGPLANPNVEGRLSDPRLRENFIARMFAYWRLRELFAGRWTAGALVRFHTAHKLILMAHSLPAYQQLGRLVAAPRALTRKDLEERYRTAFMAALSTIATTRRHTNVLQHMAGYFKDRLDDGSRRELESAIEDYRRELVPLIVPITLVRHHVRTLGIEYLAGQLYLEPHPKELMLRNHV